MPDNPHDNADLAALDREIDYQKKLTQVITEEQQPVETLYSWSAPERDFEPKTRRWYMTMAAIALVCIVLAALTQAYLLIFVIIALVVVIYTLNTIPPHEIKHQLTNRGLYTFNTIFLWKNMLCFWVTERGDKYMMHIEFKGKATDINIRTMIILVGPGGIDKIVKYMVGHVDYLGPNEVSQNIITRWAQGRYVPLLEIIGDENIVTKDPNDSPVVLKANSILVNKKTAKR